MACIRGISFCKTCGKEFQWIRHDSQSIPSFCNRKCTNRDFGIKGNKDRIFWPTATEKQKKERLTEFFEKKVIKQDGCWGWTGHVDKDGYAQLTGHNGKRFIPVKAHRFSYFIHKGEIPKGLKVCHSCDNPTCTNPKHLWLGSAKDNSQDAIKKSRLSQGENRYNAKLKEVDIPEIRRLLLLGVSKAKIARKYKVSFMTISLVEKCKTWKHVK